ncbi:SDR family NAD(P)-dependent oxidoreductase [Paenibacillus riograndensis]|uniref:Short-chain dehydrogenase/reductase SDR n=1 Tax=Paenibacillus riograndensis SBR5 TaxID=1073571 RepID=A0A0E4HBC6_9BACL|nr:SDR family NAD(P)-dependent oxidoreductase [Paenibacillus riograndensis]CQR55915.1 hypothetical protein PRIO_3512 [Paenibacillus riograndensis SBR5]
MRTILITGGTDGIGKGIALLFIKKGDRIIAIGSSADKGKRFLDESKKLGAEERAIFLQADLSCVRENHRIIDIVKNNFQSLDMLIFSATSHKIYKEYTTTTEGLEINFGLSYLSRFILGFGLKERLENSENPIIANICAPGMKGRIDLNDIQNKNNYKGSKARYHNSRLNDLLGVAYTEADTIKKIKYILFNPWAVRTTGIIDAVENPVYKIFTKVIFKLVGKPINQAILPLIELLENPSKDNLTAYIKRKEVNLARETFDKGNADQLYKQTINLLKTVL